MSKFGWKDFFRTRVPVEIITGAQVLTDNKEAPTPGKVAIMKGDGPGHVYANTIYGQKPFKLDRIEWDESHARSVGKTAGGAIVGGAVGGVVGAAVGGAIGAKRKDTSKAYIFLIDMEGVEHRVHIHCDQNTYKQLSALM